MSKRVTTVLVVLATMAWGTSVLHAQSLSPEQKETLDGRFEHIVQKAEQGKLELSIDQFSERVEQRAQKMRSRAENLTVRERMRRLRKGKAPRTGASMFTPGIQDVRPTSRRSDGTPIYGTVVRTNDPSVLEANGLRVGSSFENFATVHATPSEIASVSRLEVVTSVLSPRMYESQNDVVAGEAGIRMLNNGVGGTEYTGEGVMTCVIDSGIDWDHPDFTDENGQSRIRYIWNQKGDETSIKPPSANDPSRFGSDFNAWYGDEYMPRHIQSGDVSVTDGDGHGTHVAGTVASSGEAYEETFGSEKYKGMAPEANIIAVKTRFSNVSIIDGINYCKAVAEDEGKPLVVNMSLGSNLGPHDGTSALPLAVQHITNNGNVPGMAVITAAGNAGSPDSPIHTGPKSIAPGDSADVNIDIPDVSGSQFVADLWLYEEQAYDVSVYTPGKQDTLTIEVDGGASTDTLSTQQGQVLVFNTPGLLRNKRNLFVGVVGPSTGLSGPDAGTWSVRIRNEGSAETTLHGWSRTDIEDTQAGTRAEFADADNKYTVGPPSTSKGAIAVGNYVHRTQWTSADSISQPGVSPAQKGGIASNSSRGPTADGRTKPDVSAGGTFTVSSLSGDASFGGLFGGLPTALRAGPNHLLLSGTSMSSPVVAGTAALLMQEDPSLSTNRVRDLLTTTARVDDDVGTAPNNTFGAGKLNALRAVMSIRQSQEDPNQEVLSYEDAYSVSEPDETVADSIGVDGAERLALRFTPGMDGIVSAAYISVNSNRVDIERGFFGGIESKTVIDLANELTDSVRVQVWSDKNGTPDSPMGTPVRVAPGQFRAFTSNFVNLAGAGVAVNKGESYHLVLASGDEENGSLEVLAEAADGTSGRSLRYDGSSWSKTGNDLIVHAQVSGALSPPAAVAGLNMNTAEPENVQIGWNAATGANEYRVFRDTQPLPKSTSGVEPHATVGGSATSYTDDAATPGNTYYYRVAAVNENGTEGKASAEVHTFLYPQNLTADISRSFGDAPVGQSGASYRLVAMPGAVDQALQDSLDGKTGLDWQAYAHGRFGLVKFDGSDVFTFSAGNGFWLSSADTWSNRAEISTVSLSEDNAATVGLNEGWNIVSNPTGKDVSFSAIQAANSGTLQPPMGWDGSWYVADKMRSARSGVAYYFYNATDLNELTIPYPGAPETEGKAASPKTTKTAPLLALSARAKETGGPVSTVRVGFSEAASNGLDARDLLAPTGQFETVSLRLEAPTKQASELLVERRSPIDASSENGHTFDLRLRSQVNGPIQISPQTLTAVGDYDVALIHSGSGKSHDLHRRETVTITPSGETTSLKLAIGSKAYVEGRVENVVPKTVTLSSYPNPLRQQGTVRYTLPESRKVRLVLYDVLGREVAVLENGRKEAGRHTVRLDSGQLASGVYFGRLKAGEKHLTQKITVVR